MTVPLPNLMVGTVMRVTRLPVRGDCQRCGPDSQAMRGGWWWSWDAWKWPAELESI